MQNLKQRMRLAQRIRVRIKPHQKIILVSSFLSALALAFIVFINLYETKNTYAAVSGDYRSATTGNWNSTSTWERYNGTSWVAAVATPTSADGVITIQSPYMVTVTANVTADQVVVDAGGTLATTGGTLTLANGTGTDMTVNGTLDINSAVSVNNTATILVTGTGICRSSGNFTFGSSGSLITIDNGGLFRKDGGTTTTNSNTWIVNNGGTYQHNQNGSVLPLASWGLSSTCLVTGIVSTSPSNLNQIFGNFTWNCHGQTGNLNTSSNLRTVNGNFTMTSTGTGSLKLSSSAVNGTLAVGGYYYHDGGKIFMAESGNWNITVAADFTMTGGSIIMTDGTVLGDANPTFTVSGNTFIAGTIDMSQYTGSISGKGIGIMTLYGNLTFTSGTVTVTSTGIGYGTINFSKTGTQNFTQSGVFSGKVDFSVNSGSILNLGTNILSGGRNFTLQSGGGLLLSDANGITSSGSSGNVQNSGTRTFSTGGNYTYNGSSAQVTGNGLPSSVNNLTVDNTSGLSLTNSVVANSTLTFTNGNITTPNDTLGLGFNNSNTGTLVRTNQTVIGWFKRWISATAALNYLYPISTINNYRGVNLNFTGSPSAGGYITLNFTATNPGTSGLPLNDAGFSITSVGIEGYWNVFAESTLTAGSYHTDINADAFTGVLDYTQLRIVRRANSTSPWAVVGTHAAGTQSNTNPVAHRTGINGPTYGQFGIGGSSANPLPVGLVYFDARVSGNMVKCSWQTASEVNNDYFTLERSSSGKTFIAIDNIDGAGNSTTPINYSFSDGDVSSGIFYYRLKQTDFDGKTTCSEIKTVIMNGNIAASKVSIDNLFPNPFTESFAVNFISPSKQEVEITIMDVSGKMFSHNTIACEKGLNRYVFRNPGTMSQGYYYIKLSSAGKSTIQKIIKL